MIYSFCCHCSARWGLACNYLGQVHLDFPYMYVILNADLKPKTYALVPSDDCTIILITYIISHNYRTVIWKVEVFFESKSS